MGRKATPVENRFWPNVDKRGPDECWNWTASRQGTNAMYGVVFMNGRKVGAHRVSWILNNGEIPEGLEVCHKCDNPLCCNPAHLWLGTHQQNMHDRTAKKRNNSPTGSRNFNCRLKESDIPKILHLKKQGVSDINIGNKFGVSGPTINGIVKGWRWKQVPRQLSLF